MNGLLCGEIIPPEGGQEPPPPHLGSFFDYLKAGFGFAGQIDAPMGGVLAGYFIASFIASYFFSQPLSLTMLKDAALTPKMMTGLFFMGFTMMPLLIYTAQKVALGRASGNYFSYFVSGPLWRLVLARFVLLFFILSPVVILVSMMSMFLGGAAFLSNPFGGGFFVTFILLPIVTLFILSFTIRFFLINIHVPVVNRIELWPVFHFSRGHALKILMTFLLALLPAVFVGLLFNNIGLAHLWIDAHTPAAFAELQNVQVVLVTRDLVANALTQALFSTVLGYLNFIWMAALAYLYLDLQEKK